MSRNPFARKQAWPLSPIPEEQGLSPPSRSILQRLDETLIESLGEAADIGHLSIDELEKELGDINSLLKKLAERRQKIRRALKQARASAITDAFKLYGNEALNYLQTLQQIGSTIENLDRDFPRESEEEYYYRIIRLAHKRKLLSVLKKLNSDAIRYETTKDLEPDDYGFFIGNDGATPSNNIYILTTILKPRSYLLNRQLGATGLEGIMKFIGDEYIRKVPANTIPVKGRQPVFSSR